LIILKYHELIFVARTGTGGYFQQMPSFRRYWCDCIRRNIHFDVQNQRSLIIVLFWMLLSHASAVAASFDWQETKNFYDAGKLPEALATLQASPEKDFTYFFNTGTVFFRMGQVGNAVAYLEKADRLKPHDFSIQRNLRIARAALERQLGSHQLDPASTWSDSISDHVSLDETRCVLGLMGLLTAFLGIRTYRKNRTLKKLLFQPAILFGMIAFVFAISLHAARRFSEEHPPAICLVRETVRSGPGSHFLELSQVDVGVKLRLTAEQPQEATSASTEQPEQGLWRQVRYSQDGIGWVRASSLLLL
jgi:hypothetical protein